MIDPFQDGAPSTGSRVGPYTIEEPLGAGGKATVYLARRDDGFPVALKVLHPSSLDTEDTRRFEREYQALAHMSHPNVVQVYGAGTHGIYPWIALEYVDGSDLADVIERWKQTRSPDRFPRVERILEGLCSGLQYVHDQGLIHRDLKPDNVLVTRDLVPKISDFGVVKNPHAMGTQLTVAGRLVGTVAFMAPEQITGDHVDARTDLYALGAVLYMMLTFTRPIEATSVAGYLARHLTEVPRAPGEVDPAVPARLEHICQRLLRKDPPQRFPTARAVLDALHMSEAAPRAPLRGRTRCLDEWRERLGTLLDGAGGALAVHGAAGTGRTTLLEAMVAEARARRLDVIEVHGTDADLLRRVAAAAGLSDAPLPQEQHLADLTEALADRPTVLAVDDLDAASPETCDALARLVRDLVVLQGAQLLVMYTAADLDEAVAPLALGTVSGLPSEVLAITALDRRDTIAMVRDRGVVGAVAPLLGRRLHAEIGGIPGIVVQHLQALEAEGWLVRKGGSLRAARPLEDFRRASLPVPQRVRATIERTLSRLDPSSLEVCAVLAVLDRAAGSSLLVRCTDQGPDTVLALDGLIHQGVFTLDTTEEQELVRFAEPSTGAVLRSRLTDERSREIHARIARALGGRRRRLVSSEVAWHLEAAGDRAAAVQVYLRAARRAARSGAHGDVLDIVDRVRPLLPALVGQPEAERVRSARWAHMLRGEALLARGSWSEAVEPLKRAVEDARAEGEPGALARSLGGLGRAWYRQGEFSRAAPFLEEALAVSERGAPERGPATRALADIALRRGDLRRSGALWQEALDIAREMGSRDGEARACRGQANHRLVEGRIEDAAKFLERAEDLLDLGGDARVRAGVLERLGQLDMHAGRLARGLQRTEHLLHLLHSAELSERLPAAFALLAELHHTLGAPDEALDAAHQCLTYGTALGGSAWPSRLRAARLLCALDRIEDATAALPTPPLPASVLDDPPGQLAAIQARIAAPTEPERARDLALWALHRTPGKLQTAASQLALDVGRALNAIGDSAGARSAAKKGLRQLTATSTETLRLELLLVMHTARPEPKVEAAVRALAGRIAASLPPHMATRFSARPELAAALRRGP